MTVITVVPRLRPAIDGVGDYAFRLALQVQQDFDISTQFIVGDPTWQTSETVSNTSAMAVQQRSVESFLTLLKTASTVILHYVPHGYAQKACPFWLVNGLENWHTLVPDATLITMFHELYAFAWHRPWSSDFYLSPVQQHLAARVAQLSDVCLTSTERYCHVIDRLSQGKHQHVPVLPVFSNIGEPSDVLPLAHRKRRLIIFGQRRTKDKIYKKSQPLLAQVCASLAIEEIWDIGPRIESAPNQVNKVPLKQLGKLPEDTISQILSESLAGFLNYAPKRLGQSGIFAAYCAHGMVPINQGYLPNSLDGLVANQHYWCPTLDPLHKPATEAIVGEALSWYRRHTLAKQASVFHSYFHNVVTNEVNFLSS